MKTRKIIGLVGGKGSGKTSFARELRVHYMAQGVKCDIIPFAAGLKAGLLAMFPHWTEEHTSGALKEVVDPELGISPRFAMQTLGTEWGRQTINDQVWLRMWLQRMRRSDADVILVDDCRFENEGAYLLAYGGELLVLQNQDGTYGGVAGGHASENMRWAEGHATRVPWHPMGAWKRAAWYMERFGEGAQ